MHSPRWIVVLILFCHFAAPAQGDVVVRPEVIDDVLTNPGIGFNTFQRFNGDPIDAWTGWMVGDPQDVEPNESLKNENYPDSSIAYLRIYWKYFEPTRGERRWGLIDRALKTAHERDQTLMIRLMPYGSGREHDVPGWYREMVGEEEGLPDGTGDSQSHDRWWRTDPEDPRYVEYFGGMIREFGERYDGHPDLESVDVSIVGYWGEGAQSAHLSQKTREALVDAYLDAFQQTHLVTLLTDEETNKYGISRRSVGWRADCLGDLDFWAGDNVQKWRHMYDYYPQAIINFGMRDAWKKAPVTMEVCGTIMGWRDEHGYDKEDVRYIIEQSLKWHVSSINAKSSPIPDEWQPLMDEWAKRMGYRLALRKFTYPSTVKPGGELRFTTWWENLGVAPCYHPFPFALRLRGGDRAEVLRTDADIRDWMPGDNLYDGSVRLPSDIPAGEYELEVGILDPRSNEPHVQLAIDGKTDDGWYPMGRITVED